MPNMQKIGGQLVDVDDPCAVASALELVRVRISTGENVEEFSIQSPTTRETVRFSSAKPELLNENITHYRALCDAKTGTCRTGRRLGFKF